MTTSACGAGDHVLDRRVVDRPVDTRRSRRTPTSRRTRARAGTPRRRRPRPPTPHGFACLTIAQAGSLAEVVHEPPRGFRVVEVEVRQREVAVLDDACPRSRARRSRGSGPRPGAGSRRSAVRRRCVRARGARGAAARSSPCNQLTIAASYAEVCANASSASARRVSSPIVPSFARSSSRNVVVLRRAREHRHPRVVLRAPRAPSPAHRCRSSRYRAPRGTGRGSTRARRTARCRAWRGRRGASPCCGRRAARRAPSGAA